jgi:hypothetical protein
MATYQDAGAGKGQQHGLMREGLATGAIGAGAVALWFLLVDSLSGRPLFTPALLGAALSGSGDAAAAAASGSRVALAALYTPVHLLAFAAVGILSVALVHRAARSPALLGLLFMLFLALQVSVTGLVTILERSALGALAWYQIAAGNLVAIVAMGAFLWTRHRGVGRAWTHQYDG